MRKIRNSVNRERSDGVSGKLSTVVGRVIESGSRELSAVVGRVMESGSRELSDGIGWRVMESGSRQPPTVVGHVIEVTAGGCQLWCGV